MSIFSKFSRNGNDRAFVQFNDLDYQRLELQGLKQSYLDILQQHHEDTPVHPVVNLQKALMADINGYHVRTSLLPPTAEIPGKRYDKDRINLEDRLYSKALIEAGEYENDTPITKFETPLLLEENSIATYDPVWHRERFVWNLLHIGEDVGNKYRPGHAANDYATYYIFPLNIVIIPNGIHSVAAAALKGEAQYSIHSIVDLSKQPMFQQFSAADFLSTWVEDSTVTPSLTLWANMIEASKILADHKEIAPKQIQPYI